MVNLKRHLVQLLSALAFNSHLAGFLRGTIYRGNFKQVCLPILNCYSCPGAIGSCPVGSLQAVASSSAFYFSFYVTGFLALVGVLTGRLACGWLCPFGLIQELLHKIPSPKYVLPDWTRLIKYFVLVVPVVLLPPLSAGDIAPGTPYFCKWLCPAGTLEAAIPLAITQAGIRDALGWLFTWRLFWLAATVLFVIFIKRGFCRVLCPLGAFYSLFNGISFLKIRRVPERCNACGKCTSACQLRLPQYNLNHPECIRCLNCVHNCPAGALKVKLQLSEGCASVNVKI